MNILQGFGGPPHPWQKILKIAIFNRIVKLLALALTNLVLELANLLTILANLNQADLVNNLTKPSKDLEKSGPGLTL